MIYAVKSAILKILIFLHLKVFIQYVKIFLIKIRRWERRDQFLEKKR